MTVRTRFAPSPTGALHLGNARIGVLNWLFARHSDGQFVVRIEDTDVERTVPSAEEDILSVLTRLGLDWDEGPDVGGPHAPYRQSERSELYRDHANRLLEAERAYECFCSPEEIAERREEARASGADSRYDGRCRDLTAADRESYASRGIRPSIRFKVPEGAVSVRDEVKGVVEFDADEFGDFVILKSDGRPTYNFAVVVDDHEMRISHVIRGVGHLSNTPRQVMLYEALGVEIPTFVHVPHVLAPDGSPLSKRHGAAPVRQYLDEGYHPDGLVNYLSLLSWSSPSGEEVLSRERLVEEIDLSRVGTSDARLDPDKLEYLSGAHIRGMAPEALADRLAAHLPDDAWSSDPEIRARIAAAIQQRIDTFGQARAFLAQFYPPDPMEWSEDARQILGGPGAADVLQAVRRRLAHVEDWHDEAIIAAIREGGRDVEAGGRELFMPVRAAVAGETEGPELADILMVQGKSTTLRVLDQAVTVARSG